MDILEQIKNRRISPLTEDEILGTAAEEIKMLRDRLRNLRQKLAELGADTDLI